MKTFKLFEFNLLNRLNFESVIELNKKQLFTFGGFIDFKKGIGIVIFGITFTFEYKWEDDYPEIK